MSKNNLRKIILVRGPMWGFTLSHIDNLLKYYNTCSQLAKFDTDCLSFRPYLKKDCHNCLLITTTRNTGNEIRKVRGTRVYVTWNNLLTSIIIIVVEYQQPYEETAIPIDSNVFQVVQSISDLEERLKALITVDIQRMQDEIVNTLNRASNMNTPSTDEN